MMSRLSLFFASKSNIAAEVQPRQQALPSNRRRQRFSKDLRPTSSVNGRPVSVGKSYLEY